MFCNVLDTLCRLFFVVNKVDTIRMSEGLDEDATREYVAPTRCLLMSTVSLSLVWLAGVL
jgi:hypothetical protein